MEFICINYSTMPHEYLNFKHVSIYIPACTLLHEPPDLN